MTAAIITTPLSMPDLLGTSPADLMPTDTERHDSTPAEARERADRLRGGIVSYAQMRQDIADAYAGRDWIALGYDHWYAYVEAEFGEQLAQLDRGEQREAIGALRNQGMSVRQIASATGVGVGTVHRTLAGVPSGTPEKVTGSDGKQHPASRPTPKSTPTPALAEVPSTAPAGAGSTSPEPEPRHRSVAPDPVIPPPGSPAAWTDEEREANRRDLDRKRMIADGQKAAQNLVMSVRTEISTVVKAIDLGEKNLINPQMIADLRRVVDLLESRMEASK